MSAFTLSFRKRRVGVIGIFEGIFLGVKSDIITKF